MEKYTPPYTYTWEEWLSHMERHLEPETGTASIESILDSFRSNYKDQNEAEWKGNRFFYATWRMTEMLRSYPEKFGDLYAPGNANLISTHILYAFWRVFGGLPDNMLTREPPAEMMATMAFESKAKEIQGRQF